MNIILISKIILMEWLLFFLLYLFIWKCDDLITICSNTLLIVIMDGRRFVNYLDGGNIHVIIWVEGEINVIVDHEF